MQIKTRYLHPSALSNCAFVNYTTTHTIGQYNKTDAHSSQSHDFRRHNQDVSNVQIKCCCDTPNTSFQCTE